jgi:hypothetical protein
VTGRGRRVRFPSASVVSEAADLVPVLCPIVFVLTFEGVERTIDLSDLACPRLVRPLAAALAGIGGDDATVRRWSPGFQRMVRHLRTFVTYAAARTPVGAAELDLAGMTPALLDGFEADLSARHGHGTELVAAFMSTVVRLLRLAYEQYPQAFSAAMAGRLGYTTSAPRSATTPLDAYPKPVLEAIQAAALADVRKIRDRIDAGWRVATAGADPRVAGWSRRENVLWHISVHGPLIGPQSRHVRAVQKAPGGIRAFNAELFLTPQDLVPLLVALICCTGLEPECAKDLRADCLSSPARGFVTLAFDKKRARPHTAKTMRVRDSASVRTPAGCSGSRPDCPLTPARRLAATRCGSACVRAAGCVPSSTPATRPACAVPESVARCVSWWFVDAGNDSVVGIRMLYLTPRDVAGLWMAGVARAI